MYLYKSDILEKFLGKEIQMLNRSLVVNRKTINELLKECLPFAVTREKAQHAFDRKAIQKAAEHLPEYIRDEIKFPIFFFIDLEVPGECFLHDRIEAEFVKRIGGLKGYGFRKGRMWMSKVVANKISREYPTLFQYFYMPQAV